MVRKLGKIIVMQRLTGLQHDEVRDIDDIVDAVHASRMEIVHHPLRRRTDFDMIHYLAPVARALRRLQRDREGSLFSGFVLAAVIRPGDRTMENRTDFLCHIPHGRAIGPVRGQRHIEDRIIIAKILEHLGFTDRCICRQFFNAGDLCFTQKFLIDAKFKQCTQHAIAFMAMNRLCKNCSARKLCPRQCSDDFEACSAVRCSADNLNGFFRVLVNADNRIMKMRIGNVVA